MEVPKAVNKYLVAAVVMCLISLGIAWRLMPHFPNFTPIGAIALTVGMALGWRKSLLVVMAIMVISDYVIGFYLGMQWTWLSFGLIAGLGLLTRNLSLAWRIPLGVFGTSGLFFLVSNFGTWISSGMYSLDVPGLMQCYYMALPFLRATLSSDLLFVTLLLIVHEVFMEYRAKLGSGHYRLILDVSS